MKWISVNESMPEFNDWYLVCKYDKNVKLMVEIDIKPFSNGKFLESRFTHWMPLPPPPMDAQQTNPE